jgi:murein DD-endopeptidase MepM/ murein hydrolase activator NlpD
MMNAECPHCGGAVALHEGRPQITADGAVSLWHRACWDRKQRPIVVAPPARIAGPRPIPVAATRRTLYRLSMVFAGAALVAIVIARWAWFQQPPMPASLANVEFAAGDEPAEVTDKGIANDNKPHRLVRVETLLEATHEVPTLRDGTPLDDAFPSLINWIHPVTASAELIPTQQSRLFGEPRAGVDNPRPECGQGHCGIDLDGPRGRPVVAVAAGKVVRAERAEDGTDGRSGRFVRIEHDDGTFTSYMHLDSVADGLENGDRVSAGQYIGTLGATAVYSAPPHLHFQLEIPNHRGTRGDNTDTHFVNPAPFLVRAAIVPTADRRRPVKPAN